MNLFDTQQALLALGIRQPAVAPVQAPNDGVTDARASLANAVATGKHIGLYKGSFLVSANLTPATAIWGFGGILKPASGITIDLTGSTIIAPPGIQLFDLSLGGTIIGTPDVEAVYSTWWGADPDFVLDSTSAMQAWLTFCTGNLKPRARQVPGRYKLIGSSTNPILSWTGTTWNAIQIEGVPGQSNTVPFDSLSCVWDASLSTQTVSAAGNYAPILKMRGGSGRLSSGGVRDIAFIGNGANNAIQISDGCGVSVENVRAGAVQFGVEIFNEGFGVGAPATNGSGGAGGGAAEFNRIIHSAFEVQKAGVSFRRNVNAAFTLAATNSFHRTKIDHCWTNLPSGVANACGIFIHPGCKVYNAHFDMQTFFAGVDATHKQYAIGFGAVVDSRMPAIAAQAGGMLTGEGGAGLAEWGSPNNACYWSGSEHSLAAMKYGTLVPVYASTSYGSESSANGTISGLRRPYSYGPRSVTPGSTALTLDATFAQIITLDIISASGLAYRNRTTGVLTQNGFGGVGNFTAIVQFLVDNTAGYPNCTFAVNASGQLVISNTGATTAGILFNVSVGVCPLGMKQPQANPGYFTMYD